MISVVTANSAKLKYPPNISVLQLRGSSKKKQQQNTMFGVFEVIQ